MIALVYVDIDQGIHKGNSKVARNEKRKIMGMIPILAPMVDNPNPCLFSDVKSKYFNFRYIVNVSIYGLEVVDKHFNIEDIMFIFETYNPQFTRMELWFRFFFSVVTAFVAMAFLSNLRRFALGKK